jgi:hypothetical protein
MRDSMTVAGWVGGAMLISVSLLVLCQHAEGERTRAALQATKSHVDNRIQTLDARLTDLQADVNRKKLTSAASPPLDPKRLVKASKELDQLIGTPAPPIPPPAGSNVGESVPFNPAEAVSSSTRSPGAAAAEFVRVCHGGRWYHRPSCRRVSKRTVPIARADAELQGWRQCPTCRP